MTAHLSGRPKHPRTSKDPLGPIKRRNHIAIVGICVFLVAITWSVFGRTVGHDFVNYDDQNYVYENPKITSGLSMASLAWAFTHVHAQNWHPLTTISHVLDCQLYGLKAGGHHFTNVLLHTIAVILLFLVLRQMTGALWRSAFVAAVFAIHPLRVESVAWVAERKDVLSGVFFMLILAAYFRYVRTPSTGRYLAVAFLFALGLMTKPILVTVPFVLLLLDYWPLNRWPNRSSGQSKVSSAWLGRLSILPDVMVEKIPLLALSAGSSVATLLAQKQAIGWIEQLPLRWRLNNAVLSYILYVWQMFWPVRLAVFYPHPENRLPLWEIVLALAALVAATAAVVALRKRHPYIVTGWFWYVIMLLPVIGTIQVGWQGRADRYTYLPQIGLYILIAWAITDLTASWRHQREILGTAAVLVLGAFGSLAWIQTSYWRNSEALWSHALAVTPQNDVAENNLGIISMQRGRLEEAISRFETAIQLRPDNAPAHQNLAKAFLQKGQVESAIEHYRKFLELDADQPETRNVLGTLLLQRGRITQAVDQWQQTLLVDPQNGNAKNNLAWVFATCPEPSVRNAAKAVELGEQAAQLAGGKNPIVLRTLAAAYAESGRYSEAITAAERAMELAISNGNAGLAEDLRNNILLYRAGLPLRDSSLTTGQRSP
jgi:tetratricopeptide (TPR) repeat protein